MKSRKTNILLVEDNLPDAIFVREVLPTSDFSITSITSLSEADKLLDQDWQLVILDLSLPDGSGLDSFLWMRDKAPNIPVIILSGLEDEDIALAAVKLGAQDFISKRELSESVLLRSIGYAIERKKAQEDVRVSALKAQEAEFSLRLALRASHIGVWHFDVLKDRVEWDEQAMTIFGLEQGSVVTAEVFLDLVHPDDRDRVRQTFEDGLYNQSNEYILEFRIITAAGIREVYCAGRTFFEESGKFTRMAGIFRDITDQKLEEARTKRLALLEQREDFMTTLTHDLKTPLVAANWILQAFANEQVGPVNAEQSRLIFQLRDTNRTLLSMIQNLIEVYRLEKDVNALVPEKVDVGNAIDACINELDYIISSKKIEVSNNAENPCPYIYADPRGVRRILQNVLDNAAKFTPLGGKIAINRRLSDNEIIITVTDNGPGVAAEDQPRLFQRFSQAKAGRAYTPGSGLGLFSCKQLIEAHGGDIFCISVPGAGTTITIKLPIKSHIKQRFDGELK